MAITTIQNKNWGDFFADNSVQRVIFNPLPPFNGWRYGTPRMLTNHWPKIQQKYTDSFNKGKIVDRWTQLVGVSSSVIVANYHHPIDGVSASSKLGNFAFGVQRVMRLMSELYLVSNETWYLDIVSPSVIFNVDKAQNAILEITETAIQIPVPVRYWELSVSW